MPRRFRFDAGAGDRPGAGPACVEAPRPVASVGRPPGTVALALVALLGGCHLVLPFGSAGDDARTDRTGLDAAPVDATCRWSAFDAPVRLSTVNSTSDEWDPCISADGQELYFSSWRSGAHHIWVAQRTTDGFSEPVRVEPGSSTRDATPWLSSDGLTLFFSSTRSGGKGGFDIWYAQRSAAGGAFGPPVNLQGVNGSYDDVMASLSHDGRLLYFTSRRGGPQQLWVAGQSGQNDFGNPTPYPLPGSEARHAFASRDGRELFLSIRDGGLGGFDLWVARRTDLKAKFDAPQNMGSIINTGFDDLDGSLSRDGATLYLIRDAAVQGGRNADIWQARRKCQP